MDGGVGSFQFVCSASLDGDNQDQVSINSCDDTSSVTSALSGAIGDVDEISSASTPGKR